MIHVGMSGDAQIFDRIHTANFVNDVAIMKKGGEVLMIVVFVFWGVNGGWKYIENFPTSEFCYNKNSSVYCTNKMQMRRIGGVVELIIDSAMVPIRVMLSGINNRKLLGPER